MFLRRIFYCVTLFSVVFNPASLFARGSDKNPFKDSLDKHLSESPNIKSNPSTSSPSSKGPTLPSQDALDIHIATEAAGEKRTLDLLKTKQQTASPSSSPRRKFLTVNPPIHRSPTATASPPSASPLKTTTEAGRKITGETSSIIGRRAKPKRTENASPLNSQATPPAVPKKSPRRTDRRRHLSDEEIKILSNLTSNPQDPIPVY